MDKLLIDVTKDSEDYSLVLMNAKKLAFSKDNYTLCDFLEYVQLADTKEIMDIITNAVIRNGDIVHLYELYFLMSERKAKHFNYKLVENLIKQSKNAKLMSYTLGFTDVLDKYDMLFNLYQTKNAKWIEALKEELDVEELPGYKEALDEALNFDYFPPCLKDYGTKDISTLIELVIASKNIYHMNELADYMEYLAKYKGKSGLKVEELFNPFMKYSVGEPLHQYEFAASISSSPKESLTTMVIEEGIAKIMYYMYKYVSGVDEEKILKAINYTGNEKYIKLTK